MTEDDELLQRQIDPGIEALVESALASSSRISGPLQVLQQMPIELFAVNASTPPRLSPPFGLARSLWAPKSTTTHPRQKS